jgi:hypothetical protein
MGYASSSHPVTTSTSSEDAANALTSNAPTDGSPNGQKAPGEPSSRRDLFRLGAAALGAAAAGVAATATPAEAADGGNLVIGVTNDATNTTRLNATTGYGFWATSGGSYGCIGQSTFIGTYGSTTSTGTIGGGLFGTSNGATGSVPGVYGVATSPSAPAIFGTHSNGGNAIRAEVPASSSANTIALYSLNYSTYAGPSPGAGGFAIYGLSARGHGLVGATAAAGGAAVVGASNGVPGAYAAAFYGSVVVGGNFTVVGGAKSAAVPHPDGTHRRLYCVESPESWFEDFGEGTMVCGEASIDLDPDFAAVVDTSKYHVFLTSHDMHADLAVSERRPEGFHVRGKEHAEGTFSWRVVAKRRDIHGERFEQVEIPKAPDLPAVPDSVFNTGASATPSPERA